jgi:hypothetical protein
MIFGRLASISETYCRLELPEAIDFLDPNTFNRKRCEAIMEVPPSSREEYQFYPRSSAVHESTQAKRITSDLI